jgi:hypothetical protein
MNRYRIEVNGKIYEVGVEKIETIASAAAPKPTAAPAPKPAAPPLPPQRLKARRRRFPQPLPGPLPPPCPVLCWILRLRQDRRFLPEPYC